MLGKILGMKWNIDDPQQKAIFWGQLILGVVLISSAFLKSCFKAKRKDQPKTEATVAHTQTPEETYDDTDGQSQTRPLTPGAELAVTIQRTVNDRVLRRGKTKSNVASGDLAAYITESQRHHAFQDARRAAFEQNLSIFCSHVREEDNFVRGNNDPYVEFPPTSTMEIEQPYYSRFVLYRYLQAVHLSTLLLQSLGWSLIGGSLGTLICIHHNRHGPSWMEAYQGILNALLSDFRWLPTFMLGGHLAFYVQRWRQFMLAAWQVEGRFKDLGIMIGSDVKKPDDPDSRSLMFKFYRYMVLSMALQYQAIIPPLRDAGADICDMLVEKGLLLAEELPVLEPQTSRMRDAVLTWIGLEVKQNGPSMSGLLIGTVEPVILDKLAALRAEMMMFHGNNYYPQPNVWAAFMHCLVDTYCALMIFIYPITRFVTLVNADFYGFQPVIVVSIFLMTTCFWGALSMAKALSQPFKTRFDTFNIDALVASTEQTLFTSLRASFDTSARRWTTSSSAWRVNTMEICR